MRLLPTVRLVAEISIDDREAEVLHHLCSYSLAEWFAEKCSHKYSAEEIKKALDGVRAQASKVVAARERAVKTASE